MTMRYFIRTQTETKRELTKEEARERLKATYIHNQKQIDAVIDRDEILFQLKITDGGVIWAERDDEDITWGPMPGFYGICA